MEGAQTQDIELKLLGRRGHFRRRRACRSRAPLGCLRVDLEHPLERGLRAFRIEYSPAVATSRSRASLVWPPKRRPATRQDGRASDTVERVEISCARGQIDLAYSTFRRKSSTTPTASGGRATACEEGPSRLREARARTSRSFLGSHRPRATPMDASTARSEPAGELRARRRPGGCSGRHSDDRPPPWRVESS